MTSPNNQSYQEAAQKLVDASADLVYVASPSQRQAKAAYWSVVSDNPLFTSDTEITLAQVQQVVSDNRLPKWWKDEGFRNWFQNKDEFKQRLEYLCILAQDSAEDILLSDDPRSVNAKVSLIKALFEAGGKVAAKQKEVKLLDEGINKMDKLQLEDYLKKMGRMLDVGKETKDKETTD